MNIVKKIEQQNVEKMRAGKTIPNFKAGDTLRVHVKIKDGDKFRIQLFEGVVIARDGGMVIPHLSPFVANHTAWVWNANSRCTARQSKKLKRFVSVACVVRNCSFCANCPVKRRVLWKICPQPRTKRSQKKQNNFCLFQNPRKCGDFLYIVVGKNFNLT